MLRNRLIHLPRASKRWILALNDFFLIELSLLACFYLRLGWNPFEILASYYPVFLVTPAAVLLFLYKLKLYSSITRHAGVEVMFVLSRGISFGVMAVLLVFFFFPVQPQLPRSVLLIFWVLGIFALFTARLVAGRWLHGTSFSSLAMEFAGWKHRKKIKGHPVVVYGSGAAGRQLAWALSRGIQYVPVAFVDDDPALQGDVVSGLKVHTPTALPELIESFNSLEVLLAIPSASRFRRQEIIKFLKKFDIRVRSVPSMDELARGLVKVDAIREVDVADILGRESIPPDTALLNHSINGKRILVTGAGGSIGSELCRQILKYSPSRLVLLDNSEFNLYNQYSELEELVSKGRLPVQVVAVIGSVLDSDLVDSVLAENGIDTVYHAAAYKHVPLVESNGYQGFRNNVLGTLQIAVSAVKAQVQHFVLVSTDKAVRPTNVMGVSKRLAELVLQAFGELPELVPEDFELIENSGLKSDGPQVNNTRFTMVRFGNVLDSSGSVIPRFRQQIKAGGPVTVTHRNVTRFFMTIPEAAELVLQANALCQGGDLFILDMGSPVKIDDLARQLIHLSGLSVRDEENPEGDIEIVYTGIRPGEKLYEELLIDNSAMPTSHPKIWRANECIIHWHELAGLLAQIERAFRAGNQPVLRDLLSRPEIGYQPSSDKIALLVPSPGH
jgi:UDP-N-acetylglucosamine 4,6-dehydratase